MIEGIFYWTCFAAVAISGAYGYESAKVSSKIEVNSTSWMTAATQGGTLHPCYRTCTANETMTCYYEFTMHAYSTMSTMCGDCPYTMSDCLNPGCITAGGDVRQVNVVNHMLPGPSIQVCAGDIIQVKVTNAFGSNTATIHWHGMWQKETPYMDGVPYVTQCPILPGNSFVYEFIAVPGGTHIWHSHSGYEEAEGLHGAVIVRTADDALADYYDYDLAEHVVLVYHWFSQSTSDILESALFSSSTAKGYSLTVNGYADTAEYVKDNVTYKTPIANFTVTKDRYLSRYDEKTEFEDLSSKTADEVVQLGGYRYRFRLIDNAALYCPAQISIDNHTMKVIASDGAPVEAVDVDSMMINAGERYDFVLTADQPIGNYYMRIRGLGNCGSISSVAVLKYEGADDTDPKGTTEYDDAKRSGVLLNPVAVSVTDYSDNTLITVADLSSTNQTTMDVSGTPDYIFYVPSSLVLYSQFPTPGPYAQFNNISYGNPPVPFLTQYDEITADMICTPANDSAKDCRDDYCTCPYMYETAVDKLVELIFFDESVNKTDNHPQHLHGQWFAVVAMEYGNVSDINGFKNLADVKARNEAGLIDKKLENAPMKDTIGVPDRGFVVLRFVTRNPGYWFFHCHVSAHLEEGMAFVMKIGEDSEMSHPPSGFPKCSGNYDGRNL